MTSRDRYPDSDLKLPSGPSARRSRPAKDNDWVGLDDAEHRRPIIAIVIVSALLIAGVALIISGFRT